MDYLPVIVLILTSVGLINGSVNYKLAEGMNKGEVIGHLFKDSGLEQRYSFQIIQELRLELVTLRPSTAVGLFKLDTISGLLTANAKLDRDVLCARRALCQIELDVSVSPIQYFEIFKVVIEIIDINDNSPKFAASTVNKYISEATLAGTEFNLPLAEDLDSPVFGIIRYELQEESSVFTLRSEETDGEIYSLKLVINEMLNREEKDFYQIHVVASDGGTPRKTATLTVNITVLDINDHRPAFHNATYDVTLAEDIAAGTMFLQVTATDADQGQNSAVTYSLSERGSFSGLFAINEETGEVYTTGQLDRERKDSFRLYVTAKDSGPEALTDQALVNVRVLDVNDEAPEVKVHGLKEVSEITPVGSTIAHLSVSDLDTGINGQSECLSDQDGHFKLEKSAEMEYKVKLYKKLDFEDEKVHRVTVRCHDFGEPPLQTVKYLDVKVRDHNDNWPVFNEHQYKVEVPENNTGGAFILQVAATDNDAGDNGDIYYTLSTQANSLFSIDSHSGIITANQPLDYEQVKSVDFIAFAHDKGQPSLSSSCLITVNVFDINDEEPTFTQPFYEFNIRPPVLPGDVIGRPLAVDRDSSPYNKFTYSLTDTDLFSIDAATGDLYSNVKVTDEVTYSFTVQVEGATEPHQVNTAKVTVIYSFSSNMTAGGVQQTHSLFVIISISTVAVMFISLLVAGIVLVAVKNRRRTSTIKRDAELGTQPNLPPTAITPERLAHLNVNNDKTRQIVDYLDSVKDNESEHSTESDSTDSGKGTSDDGESSNKETSNDAYSLKKTSDAGDYVTLSRAACQSNSVNMLYDMYTKTSTPMSAVNHMTTCHIHRETTARSSKQHRVSWKDNLDSFCDSKNITRGSHRRSILKTTSSGQNCRPTKTDTQVERIPVYPNKPVFRSTQSARFNDRNIYFYKSSDICNDSVVSDNSSDGASTTSGSYVIDDLDTSPVKGYQVKVAGVNLAHVIV